MQQLQLSWLVVGVVIVGWVSALINYNWNRKAVYSCRDMEGLEEDGILTGFVSFSFIW